MERPPDKVIDGYEIWHIECGACGRKVERPGGNEFVGKQGKLRCLKCGHLGATLTRVWHVGEKPSGS